MESGSILKFLENKTLLVTGATGFLAKIFVEKILRVQPNVKKLYLLIRSADSNSALHRFQTDVIGKDLFRILKEKHGKNLQTFLSQTVTPVPGDISSENMGVKDCDLIDEMKRQVDVVINVAATTKFDERYDLALGINTFGAKHIHDFVTKCVNVKLLLHVSSAYVTGERVGLILETPFKLGETLNGKSKLDISKEKEMMKEKLKQLATENASDEAIMSAMKDFGLQRAKHHGWPNTYVFTKAMGEMLLGKFRRDVPLVILRPTIITSTYKEPFPGWVEGIRSVDSLCAGYCKGRITCFLGDPDCVLDLIPADMVVNAMIVAMASHSNQTCSQMIYHVGSSVSNPLTLSWIKDYFFRYFTKHPFLDRQGKPIKVCKLKWLSSESSFQKYMTIRYFLPLKGLEIANIALCQALHGLYMDVDRTFKIELRFAELFKAYVFSKTIYDDLNLMNLHSASRESNEVEKETFFFDPKSIRWEDYFMNTHIPGLVKYAIKK